MCRVQGCLKDAYIHMTKIVFANFFWRVRVQKALEKCCSMSYIQVDSIWTESAQQNCECEVLTCADEKLAQYRIQSMWQTECRREVGSIWDCSTFFYEEFCIYIYLTG